MFGCCYCSMQKFKFKNKEIDPQRLEKTLELIKASKVNEQKKLEIEKNVLKCNCGCHIDGQIVMC